MAHAMPHVVRMPPHKMEYPSSYWPHIGRYCDTIAAIPHIGRYLLKEVGTRPKWCDTPPWRLVSQRHICAIPHFATYRARIVRYPIKTSTKVLCDTIATSIARYEKYRCWAYKSLLCRRLKCNSPFFWMGFCSESLRYLLESIVPQGSCKRCLAIWGGSWLAHLVMEGQSYAY